MNYRLIITLGLLLGLLLNLIGIIGNGYLLNDLWSKAIPVRPDNALQGPISIIISLLSDFMFGPMLVWLYAAMIPRFGNGIITALKAAIIIWLLAVVIPYMGIVRIGWLPVDIVIMTSLLALVGFIPAAWLTQRYYVDNN